MSFQGKKSLDEFKQWLNQPVPTWERIIIIILAAFIFSIIGALIRFFTSESIPLFPFSEFIDIFKWWALTGAIIGAILGALKPRIMLCILWPFTLIGLTGS